MGRCCSASRAFHHATVSMRGGRTHLPAFVDRTGVGPDLLTLPHGCVVRYYEASAEEDAKEIAAGAERERAVLRRRAELIATLRGTKDRQILSIEQI